MSSHFSTGTTIRTSPAWCKKGMFVGVPPDVGNRPTSLNALAQFRYVGTAVDVDLFQLIWTPRNQANTAWEGATGQTGYNIHLEILDQPTPGEYKITLQLRQDLALVADQVWIHHQPPDQARWNTGRLTAVQVPGLNEQSVHIMG